MTARSGREEKNMRGQLYLCATPIGNLDDMTYRVVDTLKKADLIAAEDTRHSRKLLNHFDIHTPMTSYHEHNRYEKAEYLIGQLLDGKNVALITDAGTPGISDPGEELVRQAYENGISVTSLPGACACVTALSMSGLPTRRFCFEAFLPADKKERQRILAELKTETRTIVLYEAPHRLARTLELLLEELGNRRLTICKELTKKHEAAVQTTIAEALLHYRETEPRGEYVLVIEAKSFQEQEQERQRQWRELSVEEHVAYYETRGYTRKDAMKRAAADRGVGKREIYALLNQDRN